MILRVNKHSAQGPYNQLGGSQKDQSSHWRRDYDEVLTPVATSCWLHWTTQAFQNGVYFQSREADLFLEENN